MSLFQSPSHQFVSTSPELMSMTDTTVYRAVCLVARPGNTASFQFGGGQITNEVGGVRMSPAGISEFWINPGAPFHLSDILVAGAVGDWVDTVCIPWS